MEPTTLYEDVNEVRKKIKEVAKEVHVLWDRKLLNAAHYPNREKGNFCAGDRTEGFLEHEAIKNLEASYRHLEDASMRLGKTLQALDGGVSVYDKESTVGA